MKKRNQEYYFIVINCNTTEDDKSVRTTFSTEKLPTRKDLEVLANDVCKRIGKEYRKGSAVISFFARISQEEYDVLNSNEESGMRFNFNSFE